MVLLFLLSYGQHFKVTPATSIIMKIDNWRRIQVDPKIVI
jgi:hypothetical protein